MAKLTKTASLIARAEAKGYVPVRSGKALKQAACKTCGKKVAIVFRTKSNRGKRITACPYCHAK